MCVWIEKWLLGTSLYVFSHYSLLSYNKVLIDGTYILKRTHSAFGLYMFTNRFIYRSRLKYFPYRFAVKCINKSESLTFILYASISIKILDIKYTTCTSSSSYPKILHEKTHSIYWWTSRFKYCVGDPVWLGLIISSC